MTFMTAVAIPELSTSLDVTSSPDGIINDNINLKTIISALISLQHDPNHM